MTESRLFFSEPHQPHLMLEAGSLSSAEYEAQVRARHDFQRLQQRDNDGDRQVWLCKVKLWCPLKLYVSNRKMDHVRMRGLCSQSALSVLPPSQRASTGPESPARIPLREVFSGGDRSYVGRRHLSRAPSKIEKGPKSGSLCPTWTELPCPWLRLTQANSS